MTTNPEVLGIPQLALPEMIQAWAFALAQQTNEVIVRGILWEESTDGQYPHGSVLDRPQLTSKQRKQRFRERMNRRR